MPYVAMREVKWCDPDTRKTYVVPAGDEVKPPVRPALIRQGTIAYLDVTPGRSWDERMQQEAAPAEPVIEPQVAEVAGSPVAAGEVPAASVAPVPASMADLSLDVEEDSKPARKTVKKTSKKPIKSSKW